jgi:transcriptional regulator with XRE-family HTH domain
MKLKDVSELIGISQGSLSDLENNNSLPSAETIARLYLYTDINIFWLMFNRGPQRKGKTALAEARSQLSRVNEEIAPYRREGQARDSGLDAIMERVIRVYEYGDPEKIAHLKGFLLGADPGER